MTSSGHPDESAYGPAVLEEADFLERLESEVALVRRKGGMLSLLLVGTKSWRSEPPAGTQVRGLVVALRGQVRQHDVLGVLESAVAVLLPATTAVEASCASVRLLQRTPAEDAPLSIGLASAFGEVEGGAAALLSAALGALEEASPRQIVTSRVHHGHPPVLVLDDNLFDAARLVEMLSESGWEGCPCATDEALQRVAEPRYSAFFLSVTLLRGGGAEILRAALASYPRRPVVLMGGGVVDASILDALEIGPVLFLKKPVAQTDLASALKALRDSLPGAPDNSRRRRA